MYYNVYILHRKTRRVKAMDNKDDNNTILLRIGQKIQYYRRKANLTQEKLSEKIDITPNHLSKLEAGRHNLHFDTIILLAKALDVPVDAFLEDIEDNQINTFLEIMKSDISSMSKNQLNMLKRYIELLKEFDF